MEKGSSYVNSILHAVQVINLFTVENSLGVTEISKRLGLHKATTFKILQTLKHENWIIQDEKTKNYSLGTGILPVAQAVHRTVNTQKMIAQMMCDLENYVQEDIVFCKLVGKEVICIVKIESDHLLVSSAKEGSSLPLHMGATGLALLAYQDEELIEDIFQTFSEELFQNREEFMKDIQKIRTQGYAFTCSNYDKGIGAVGAPVPNEKGQIQYSLSIVGPVNRMLKVGMDQIRQSLIDTANKIGGVLYP